MRCASVHAHVRVCMLEQPGAACSGAALPAVLACHELAKACIAVLLSACFPTAHVLADLDIINLITHLQAERILQRVRKSPTFLEEAQVCPMVYPAPSPRFGFHTAAGRLWSTPCSRLHQCTLAPLVLQAAIAVFDRQGVEADAYVKRRLGELGGRAGERLCWCVLCLLWSACDAGCLCRHWYACTHCCHASAGTPCPAAHAAPLFFPSFPLGMPSCPAPVGLCAGCGGPAYRARLTCSTPSAASCYGPWQVGGLRHTNAQGLRFAPCNRLAPCSADGHIGDSVLHALSSFHCDGRSRLPPALLCSPSLCRYWFASAAMQTCAPSCYRCCWSGTCCSRGGRRQERALAR